MKRLKKDCPCEKCQHWRSERTLRKMQEKMAAAYARMMESTRSIQPHSESEANMEGLRSYGLASKI